MSRPEIASAPSCRSSSTEQPAPQGRLIVECILCNFCARATATIVGLPRPATPQQRRQVPGGEVARRSAPCSARRRGSWISQLNRGRPTHPVLRLIDERDQVADRARLARGHLQARDAVGMGRVVAATKRATRAQGQPGRQRVKTARWVFRVGGEVGTLPRAAAAPNNPRGRSPRGDTSVAAAAPRRRPPANLRAPRESGARARACAARPAPGPRVPARRPRRDRWCPGPGPPNSTGAPLASLTLAGTGAGASAAATRNSRWRRSIDRPAATAAAISTDRREGTRATGGTPYRSPPTPGPDIRRRSPSAPGGDRRRARSPSRDARGGSRDRSPPRSVRARLGGGSQTDRPGSWTTTPRAPSGWLTPVATTDLWWSRGGSGEEDRARHRREGVRGARRDDRRHRRPRPRRGAREGHDRGSVGEERHRLSG